MSGRVDVKKVTVVVAKSYREMMAWCSRNGINPYLCVFANRPDKIYGLDDGNVDRVVVLDKSHEILDHYRFRLLKSVVNGENGSEDK